MACPRCGAEQPWIPVSEELVGCQSVLQDTGAACGAVYQLQRQASKVSDVWDEAQNAYDARQLAADTQVSRERERKDRRNAMLQDFLQRMASAGNPGTIQIHFYTYDVISNIRRASRRKPTSYSSTYRERINRTVDAWLLKPPDMRNSEDPRAGTALSIEGKCYNVEMGGRDDKVGRGNEWLTVKYMPTDWDGVNLPAGNDNIWQDQDLYRVLREQGLA